MEHAALRLQGGDVWHGGFKEHCAFGFWKGELIFGGDKKVEQDAMGHFGRITSLATLPNERCLRAMCEKLPN